MNTPFHRCLYLLILFHFTYFKFFSCQRVQFMTCEFCCRCNICFIFFSCSLSNIEIRTRINVLMYCDNSRQHAVSVFCFQHMGCVNWFYCIIQVIFNSFFVPFINRVSRDKGNVLLQMYFPCCNGYFGVGLYMHWWRWTKFCISYNYFITEKKYFWS